jgi:hypothetical protein
MTSLSKFGAVAVAIVGLAGSARADVTLVATDNATVQPSGPRTGTNGKQFFNMEGTSNGTFADFGVVDFATTGAGPVSNLNLLTLRLTEDNASFTKPGGLAFYITTDTTTNIQPGTSPLAFNTNFPPQGLDGQLSTLLLLGTGTFTSTSSTPSGKVDTYSFALTSAEAGYLNGQLGTGAIRLVIAPTDANVSATFAGFSDPDFTGPRLTLAAVPEPGPLLQAALGATVAAGAWAFRRRKAA